jgi:indole-3-glycerol phosphate synthase
MLSIDAFSGSCVGPPGGTGASAGSLGALVDPSGPALEGTLGYLHRIVPSVIDRLEERKQRVPLSQLQALAETGVRSSFAEALRAPGVSLIAEVKRASPSKGLIRPGLEAGELAKAYERAGARAISVLTEEEHFLGSPDDLRAAAAATRLPVIRKDFILDEYQLYEAKAWGASAVLLIAALLSDETLRHLARLAGELGLDVLLEVHDRSEMVRALSVEDVIIGVNNRDLRTFVVELQTTFELAGLVPADRLLVGESGIRTHADVVQLAACGVNGVLVGESLLRSPDVVEAVATLMQPVPEVAQRSIVVAKTEETR